MLEILSHGVPQGSVLGPTLFLLYINDICSISTISKLILFADDTTIIFSVNKDIDPSNLINTELIKFTEWLQVNKLSLNPKKTQVIAYNLVNPDCITISVNNNKLQLVQEINFLGIIFDDKLTWRSHVETLYKRIHSGVAAMLRCRSVLPTKILRTIYFSIIHPHILYGIVLWGSAGATVLKQLNSCHQRAIKICKNHETSTNIQPISKLYQTQLGLFMFQAFSKKLPPNIQKYFYLTNIPYQTRNNMVNFSVNTKGTKVFNNKPSIKGPYFWNSLPSEIKLSGSPNTFKSNLKKHVYTLYRESIL